MTYENPNAIDVVLEKILLDMIITPKYMKEYLKKIDLKGNERVMEFGCGAGNCSRWLAKNLNGGSLTCVDVSEFWMEKAKKRLNRFSNVEFFLGDINKDFNSNKKFDLIFIHQVIHDIARGERQEIIDSLVGILSENGRIFIGEPINEDHGMPLKEIRGLMENSGMKENDYFFNKVMLIGNSYLGIYEKNNINK